VSEKDEIMALVDDYGIARWHDDSGETERAAIEARVAALVAERDEAKSPDANVESVRAMLLERSKVGILKYGVTTERGDLSIKDWLRHMQQEMLDGAVYAEAAIAGVKEADAVRDEWKTVGELAIDEAVKRIAALDAENRALREAVNVYAFPLGRNADLVETAQALFEGQPARSRLGRHGRWSDGFLHRVDCVLFGVPANRG